MKAQLEPMIFSRAAGAAGQGSAEAAWFSAAMLSSTHLVEYLSSRGEERWENHSSLNKL